MTRAESPKDRTQRHLTEQRGGEREGEARASIARRSDLLRRVDFSRFHLVGHARVELDEHLDARRADRDPEHAVDEVVRAQVGGDGEPRDLVDREIAHAFEAVRPDLARVHVEPDQVERPSVEEERVGVGRGARAAGVARRAGRVEEAEHVEIGDRAEENVDLLRARAVLVRGGRDVQPALVEPRVVANLPLRGSAGGARGDLEHLAMREVDRVEQRRAAQGLEDAARGEQAVRGGAPERERARALARLDAPEVLAPRRGRHGLEVDRLLELPEVAAH
jgi:hypothetical protein